MGTVLLLFVICLMVVFIVLTFIPKANDADETESILLPEEIKKVKEKAKNL